ncbi:alpha/beta hydrolase [Compostimonas suwonensis]|uniref:Alpha-beta hydrolase superfamily lysophospholipase n=1 Tax=Compostimonas suwonensis TaxID=1048394 RepID=A0A2M9C3A9_9MICO|nr:alpha/beta hydrolase [Compostimonas suwonensis]PJJ65006.1 alpha-beta hydrolase superfamily lysophospholipase [Compostimonas suwonensis]
MSDPVWRPDVLGPGFEQLTLPLAPDDEGEVVATLVRYVPRRFSGGLARGLGIVTGPAAGADVLYVHGWSDYFFQSHLAAFWHRMGARFFALDLRKYGRSLRANQTPGYVTDLAVYDEDLDAALAAMGRRAGSARPLVLMGHSTGGLTLSLWAARHPGAVAGLVLNSPWLEFQARQVGRQALAPLIGLQARVAPLAPLPTVDLGFYTRSVSKEFDGSWEYNGQWRPVQGFPTHPAWLSAILAGHARVADGLGIDAPVLTMLSARSVLLPRWTPAMMSADIVLNVDDIAERTVRLGPTVSVVRLDGALHDIMLSIEPVREEAYAQMTRWLRGYL